MAESSPLCNKGCSLGHCWAADLASKPLGLAVGNRRSYMGFDSLVQSWREKQHEGNLPHRVCGLETFANMDKGKSQKRCDQDHVCE